MKDSEQKNFMPLDLATLRVGTLVDRSIYVHLPKNERYVLLVHALHPLESAMLEKLKRFGQIYASEPDLRERYPLLEPMARRLREICDDRTVAPFEKNRTIREITSWLRDQLAGGKLDPVASIFTIHLAFGIPHPETLLHVADLSLENYERSLRLGAIAGLLALWLGYTDSSFVAEFSQAVFCRELMTLESIPGVGSPDHRFKYLVQIGTNFRATSDELAEVIELARWLAFSASAQFGQAPRLRAARKLFKGLQNKAVSRRSEAA